QAIDGDVGRQWRQAGLASGHDLVVVSVLVVNDGVAGVFRADGEYGIVLGAEVAAVRSGPPQPLAVARHGGQDHVARQVMPAADAGVLANSAHARVIARFGEVVLAV